MRRARLCISLALTAAACAADDARSVVSATACGGAALGIAQVQGTGPVSPELDRLVTVEGAVTWVSAETDGQLRFFLQALTPDADPHTSEGVLVILPAGADAPTQGERARVRGWVEEIAGVTAVSRVEMVEHCGRTSLRPQQLELSSQPPGERWEGMWITLPETWTLLDTSGLRARGEVTVSSAGRRYAPGHPLGERAEESEASLWIVSGLGESAGQWARAGLAAQRLRLGARAAGLSGVLLSGSTRRLAATPPPNFQGPPMAPPRESPPGSLRVVALNLDNYFATPGPRGASSELEQERQRAKLVAALSQLDADILALTELGNDAPSGEGVPASLSELLLALNAAVRSSEPYEVSETGSDASALIRSAIAYRTRRLRAQGPAQFVSSPVFRRAPLVQTFEAEAHRITLAVVHFKSKLCLAGESALGAEGCGALARQQEALELAAVASRLPPADKSELLVIGDLNSDALEAPSDLLRRAGFVDLLATIPSAERYSYVFEGRASLLDHALASAPLAARLARAQIWHINADAPELLDYSLDNPAAAYQPDALRSSDHDPLVIDLEL
jgi:uncharacterized protein